MERTSWSRFLSQAAVTLLAAFCFLGGARADVVTIGNGSTANKFLPAYSKSSYSYTQQIYTATEIGTAGTINSIAFKNTGAEKTRTCSIYMKLTSKAAFASDADWVAMSDDDLVFTGDITFTVNAWTTITLNEAFAYDGTSNLIVAVADNTGSYSSNFEMTCLVFDATNQAIRTYGTAINIANPSVYGDKMDVKNQIQLDITPGTVIIVDKPTTFEVSDITGYSAKLTWTGGTGTYNLELKEADDEWEPLDQVEGYSCDLDELNPFTDYTARIQSVDENDHVSGWKTVKFKTLEVCPEGKVCIGTGTTTKDYLPANNSYSYSLTQQIYTADEIGEEGAIMSIDFFKDSNTAMVKDLDIYIVSTNKYKFDSPTDWIPVTADDLVFSGTVTFTDKDWTTIELEYPFVYNGTSNIAIVVDNNTGSSNGTTPFYAFATPKKQTLFVNSDTDDFNPINITVTGTGVAYKNRIRLGIGEPPAVFKPKDLTVVEVGAKTTVLSWTEKGSATAWQICLNDDEEHLIAADSNPFTLTDLTPETNYTATVRATNGEAFSAWSNTVRFTTIDDTPEPTDLSVSPQTTTAEVSWNGLAERYDIEWAEVPAYEPTSDACWLHYDNGSLEVGIGDSHAQTWTWGVMYPSPMLNGNSYLHKVAIYEYPLYWTMPNYTVNIYAGGDTAPRTLIATETVTPTGMNGFHEITLATPLAIDPTQNLWITVTAVGTYILNVCTNNEVNNQWYIEGDTWVNLAEEEPTLADYGWMIRGFIDNAAPTYDWTTETDVTSPCTINGLNGDTEYAVRVRGDFGAEGESDWVATRFTTLPINIELADNDADEETSNSEIIAEYDGMKANVTLTDRKLYKDGLWNTLCLPFDVVLEGSPLEGATAKTLTDATMTGTLVSLTFGNPVDVLQAGKPYIIRWDKAEGYDEADPDTRDVKDPEFTNVIINDVEEADRIVSPIPEVQFIGYYDAKPITDADEDIYYMKAGKDESNNDITKLVCTAVDRTLHACRAYFQFATGSTSDPLKFTLDFGDGEATGITTTNLTDYTNGDDSWYSLDGRKLLQQPTRKGVYIQNGVKVVIK